MIFHPSGVGAVLPRAIRPRLKQIPPLRGWFVSNPTYVEAPTLSHSGATPILVSLLLVDVGFGDADGQGADARDDAYAFGDTDGSAGVENVEQVRTLQAKIERAKNRKAATLGDGGCGLFAIRLLRHRQIWIDLPASS